MMLVPALALAFLWGAIQGMIMIAPGDRLMTSKGIGIRGHAWFDVYHRLLALFLVGFVAVVHWWPAENFPFTIGAMLLVWSVIEMGYGYSRNKALWPNYENVFGSGWRPHGFALDTFRAARITLGLFICYLWH